MVTSSGLIADRPASKLKAALTLTLDVVLWAVALIYLSGGIEFHGKLRLTYIQDFFTIAGICYVLFRLIAYVRFRDTSFGRSALDVVERFTAAIFERKWSALKGMKTGSLLLSALLLYSLGLFLYLPLLTYQTDARIWDIGFLTNTMYNASQTGHFYTYILSNGLKPLEYVPHNHLTIPLFLFAPIYRLFPHAEILLFFQSLSLLSGAFPLYRLGKKVLPKAIPAWYPVVIYFLWDSLYWLNIWDFHDAPFFIPFTLWAYYFIEIKEIGWAFASMTAMAIWREDAWWTFAAMSVYIGFVTRRWFVASLGFLVGFVIFPFHVAFLNQVNTLGGRYDYLGSGFGSAAHVLAHDPLILLRVALDHWNFFRELVFRSGGGIFLLAGPAMLPAIPGVGEVSLSTSMFHWSTHYVGNFLAPVLAATLYGWKNLAKFFDKHFPQSQAFEWIWKFSLVLAFTQLGFSLTGGFHGALREGAHRACGRELRASVPAEVPLLATSDVGGLFSNRVWLMVPDPSPHPSADQTRAQWLISNRREDLLAGLKGSQPVTGWKVVWRGCENYFVAQRE